MMHSLENVPLCFPPFSLNWLLRAGKDFFRLQERLCHARRLPNSLSIHSTEHARRGQIELSLWNLGTQLYMEKANKSVQKGRQARLKRKDPPSLEQSELSVLQGSLLLNPLGAGTYGRKLGRCPLEKAEAAQEPRGCRGVSEPRRGAVVIQQQSRLKGMNS